MSIESEINTGSSDGRRDDSHSGGTRQEGNRRKFFKRSSKNSQPRTKWARKNKISSELGKKFVDAIIKANDWLLKNFMEALNQFGKFDIRKPLTEKKETDERTVPRRSFFFWLRCLWRKGLFCYANNVEIFAPKRISKEINKNFADLECAAIIKIRLTAVKNLDPKRKLARRMFIHCKLGSTIHLVWQLA